MNAIPLRTILLAAFLVAVPAASAIVQAELEADRIQSQGIIHGNAPLTALLHPYLSNQGASLPGFELSAEQFRIEVDHAEMAIVIPGIISDQPTSKTFVEHHEDATASGQQTGAGYRFTAVSESGADVSIEASCASQQPSGTAEIPQPAFVQSEDQRPDTVIDARRATQWQACDESAVATIAGDFWFSAWDIALEVEDSEGRHAYWSGHRDDQPVTQDQELYVYVTNGTLQIPLGAASDYALFLGSGSLEVSGSVQLSNARGRLTTPSSQLDVGGDSVILDGDLQIGMQRRGDALQVDLAGDSGGAIINGQAMLLTATAPDSAIALGWWWGLLALFAVAGLGTRFLIRRHGHLDRVPSIMPGGRREWWALRLLGLALRANERGWHRLSRTLATWAAHWFPELPEARKMVAIASSHVGRLDKAVEALENLYEELPEGTERAEAACCAAASCMRLEDPETAMAWIQRGFPEDPMFVLRRLDKPIYAPLRGRPGFEALQAGSSVLLGRIAMDVAFA